LKLIIHEAFFNKILTSISRDRKEFFGVHTTKFASRIDPPWNKNVPKKALMSPVDKSEVHYDIRGQKPEARLANGAIKLLLKTECNFLKVTSREKSANFKLSILLHAVFSPDVKSTKVYRLLLEDVLIENLLPAGLKQVLSWQLSAQINNSKESELGIPKVIQIIKGVLSIKISQPEISNGKLILVGRLV